MLDQKQVEQLKELKKDIKEEGGCECTTCTCSEGSCVSEKNTIKNNNNNHALTTGAKQPATNNFSKAAGGYEKRQPRKDKPTLVESFATTAFYYLQCRSFVMENKSDIISLGFKKEDTIVLAVTIPVSNLEKNVVELFCGGNVMEFDLIQESNTVTNQTRIRIVDSKTKKMINFK